MPEEDAIVDQNKDEGLKREADKEEDLERKRLKKEEKAKESDKKIVRIFLNYYYYCYSTNFIIILTLLPL